MIARRTKPGPRGPGPIHFVLDGARVAPQQSPVFRQANRSYSINHHHRTPLHPLCRYATNLGGFGGQSPRITVRRLRRILHSITAMTQSYS